MPSAISFYADEHVPRAVVQGLRQRGLDVLMASDVHGLGDSDEAHLSRATAQGRVIITQDVDFLRMHASGLKHAGIVYVPQGTPIGDFIRGITLIYQVLDSEAMKNTVEFL